MTFDNNPLMKAKQRLVTGYIHNTELHCI